MTFLEAQQRLINGATFKVGFFTLKSYGGDDYVNGKCTSLGILDEKNNYFCNIRFHPKKNQIEFYGSWFNKDVQSFVPFEKITLIETNPLSDGI